MHYRRRLRYKGVSVGFFGLPEINPYREKKSKDRVLKRQYLRSFTSYSSQNPKRNLLVIYDIPEGRKKERDWFRRQLVNLDFIMIQRSAWVGPSPLPFGFLAYLKDIGLEKEFKTFKLAKNYPIPK